MIAYGGRCGECGLPLPLDWDLDHIVPLADGGADAPDNLQPLCPPCHRAKTAREASQRAEFADVLNANAYDEEDAEEEAMGPWTPPSPERLARRTREFYDAKARLDRPLHYRRRPEADEPTR